MSISLVLRLLLISMASFRSAQLISIDYGYGHVFEKFRLWLGKKASSRKSFWINFAELICCPYCLGVWFSAIFAISIFWNNVAFDVIIIVLACSGLQSIAQDHSRQPL